VSFAAITGGALQQSASSIPNATQRTRHKVRASQSGRKHAAAGQLAPERIECAFAQRLMRAD
jgi:hypothetical protein